MLVGGGGGGYQSKISNSSDEYYLESLPSSNPDNTTLWICKSFHGIEAGDLVEFSFEYRSPGISRTSFTQNNKIEIITDGVPSQLWQKKSLAFYVAESPTPRTLMLVFSAGYITQPTHVRNIRLKAMRDLTDMSAAEI